MGFIFDCSWRWWFLGPGGNPWVFFLWIFLFTSSSFAESAAEVRADPKFTNFRPYVPESKDYFFELGSMWEEQGQYWLGGGVGFHLGRCVWTKSETCQHYADILGGAGGRDGQTNGLAFGSLRWQFVNFPSVVSTHARLLLGVMNIRDEQRDFSAFAYGLGGGLTTSIHERVDLGFEARMGGGDHVWSQAFITLHIKADRWLNYFAGKIKSIGKDAAEATGSLFKSKAGNKDSPAQGQ